MAVLTSAIISSVSLTGTMVLPRYDFLFMVISPRTFTFMYTAYRHTFFSWDEFLLCVSLGKTKTAWVAQIDYTFIRENPSYYFHGSPHPFSRNVNHSSPSPFDPVHLERTLVLARPPLLNICPLHHVVGYAHAAPRQPIRPASVGRYGLVFHVSHRVSF
jgi:hypothetical protein